MKSKITTTKTIGKNDRISLETNPVNVVPTPNAFVKNSVAIRENNSIPTKGNFPFFCDAILASIPNLENLIKKYNMVDTAEIINQVLRKYLKVEKKLPPFIITKTNITTKATTARIPFIMAEAEC